MSAQPARTQLRHYVLGAMSMKLAEPRWSRCGRPGASVLAPRASGMRRARPLIEDARAFVAKMSLVSKYRLRGYSAWVLGPEDPKTWDALRKR